MTAAGAALEQAHRDKWASVLATLARHVGGDLALAEDAVMDAFVAAAAEWPRRGVPARPGAWLTVTARRKAVDRVRRERAFVDRLPTLHRLMALEDEDPALEEPAESMLVDDRLRLVFTCCHPALALEARVALTLRSLGGLGVPELARAFLTTEAAMARRLGRAKEKIAVAGIAYEVPPDERLLERLAGVLRVVYSIYTEGHTATTGGALVRTDLCLEALRLVRLLAALMPDDAETLGLLALLELTDARRPARADGDGAFVALAEQDRSVWDRDAIARGTAALDRALRLRRLGPFQLQAAVSALHADAGSWKQTDWPQIALLYGRLAELDPSPVVTVNRAVAVAQAHGAPAGLELLAPLGDDPRLAAFVPLHAARAELLRRTGDAAGARAAYGTAIAATTNVVERAELERRRASTGGTAN